MARVAAPLRRIGALIDAAPGGRLPLTVDGLVPARARPSRLNALGAGEIGPAARRPQRPGPHRVVEPVPTRDHLERMLQRSAPTSTSRASDIRLRGEAELTPRCARFPRRPLGGGLPGRRGADRARVGAADRERRRQSAPHRLFRPAARNGRGHRLRQRRDLAGEPVADLVVRHSVLPGCDVPPEMVPA